MALSMVAPCTPSSVCLGGKPELTESPRSYRPRLKEFRKASDGQRPQGPLREAGERSGPPRQYHAPLNSSIASRTISSPCPV